MTTKNRVLEITERGVLRVGKINYVNTAPFYHELLKKGTIPQKRGLAPFLLGEVVEGSPAEINRAMRVGEVDVAPISSLAYAFDQDRYVLLPEFCIGSTGFGRSVLLLSWKKIENLGNAKIVLSDKSLSSQALLQILLRKKFGFHNEFVEASGSPDALLADGDAALVIGDEALFYESQSFVYKYDLSQLWWDWTNLPFCFALWAVDKTFAESQPEVLEMFCSELQKNVTKNLESLEPLVRDGLSLSLSDKRFSQVFGYLSNLNFFLDDAMREGLKRFYNDAAELGLAPHVKHMNWLDK